MGQKYLAYDEYIKLVIEIAHCICWVNQPNMIKYTVSIPLHEQGFLTGTEIPKLFNIESFVFVLSTELHEIFQRVQIQICRLVIRE